MKEPNTSKLGPYEHRSHPLLSRPDFYKRVVNHSLLAAMILSWGLGIGVLGYHVFGKLPWLDSLLNASMILSGMGPVDLMQSNAGKFFASFYALFSGLIFIGVASMMAAPFVHRMLHRLHLTED